MSTPSTFFGPTAAHLARTGSALLLVPVEPQPPKADFLGPGWFWNRDWSEQIYGIWCGNWEATAPHAPGDVIAVGDLGKVRARCGDCSDLYRYPGKATVVEVLPPVQMVGMETTDIVAAGLWISDADYDAPGGVGRLAQRFAEAFPGVKHTAYVWRVKLEAAEAAEPKE